MRRSAVLLLTCLLALATGVALLRASMLVTPPALPPAPARVAATANIVLVQHYYDAVNVALRTGDATALEALVVAELVEHPAQLSGLPGRAGLVQSILTLRATTPGLRVSVDELHATGTDRVTARVHATGVEPGRFLGLALPPELRSWPLLEEFRIEDEQIVEHWIGETKLVLLEPLFRETLVIPSIEAAFVQLARLTYPAASEVPLRPESARRLVYLDVGVLSLAPHTLGENPPAPAMVVAGQVLTETTGLLAHNAGLDVVAVIEVTLTGGLARGEGVTPNWQPLEVAGGRVTLAPGATLALPDLPGPTLVAVEAGTLDLTAGTDRIWTVPSSLDGIIRADRLWTVPVALAGDPGREAHDHLALGAGQSALVAPGATVYWHNPAEVPTTMLVVTLLPATDPVCLGSPACQQLISATAERSF